MQREVPLTGRVAKRLDNMTNGEMTAKVVSVLPLERFDGEALLAHFDPRYVVALMPEQPRQSYAIPSSDVVLPAHQVVFFAIHSPVQLFMQSEVIGEVFKLNVEVDTTPTGKRFRLKLVPSP